MNETVGDKIKALRKTKGISQRALAKDIGYANRSSISDLEKAKKIPLERAKQLADYFNVPISYLYKEEIEEKPRSKLHLEKPKESKTLYEIYAELSGEDKYCVLSFATFLYEKENNK